MKSLLSISIFLISIQVAVMGQTAICQNVVVSIDESGQVILDPFMIDNGSSGVMPLQYEISPSILTCADLGVVPVTLTVTDATGGMSSCTAEVFLEDPVSPNAICNNIPSWPIDTEIPAEEFGLYSDNCGVESTLVLPNTFSAPGDYSLSLIVFDVAGNVSTCISFVTVTGEAEDVESPVITECATNIDVNAVDESCNYIVEDFTGLITATDNVTLSENLSVTQFPAPGSMISGSGQHSILFTVTDEASNSSVCTSMIVLEDITPPTLVNCPSDQNGVILTNYVFPDFTEEMTVYDNCSDNLDLTFIQVPSENTISTTPGIQVVEIQVVDENGNVGLCTFNLELFDETDISAFCQNVDLSLDAFGNVQLMPEMVDDGSYGSGSLVLELSENSFSCNDVGANSVTLVVTDEAGNTDECFSVVTVMDAMEPEVDCSDYDLMLDGSGNGMISVENINDGAFDNCGVSTMTLSQTSFNASDIGSVPVTLSVMDFSGNVATCVANVNVSEVGSSPVAICQGETVLLDATGNAMITAAQINDGSYDNGTIVSMELDMDVFDCTDLGSNVVTMTITDDEGFMSSCTSIVNVYDLQFPVLTTLDITLQLDENGEAVLLPDDVVASSSDNCNVQDVSVDQSVFTCADLGSNLVTVSIFDPSGNIAQAEAEVIIQDNNNPVALCQDITIQLDESGNASIDSESLDGGSTDNCSVMSFTLSQTNFITDDIGANDVELTVTDVNGNSSSCTSVVIVVSDSDPFFTCPGDMSLEGEEDCTLICPDFQDECTAQNFCGEESDWVYTQSPMPGSVLEGVTEIVMTISDECGNVQTCSFTVSLSGLLVIINQDGGTLYTDMEAINYQWYYCGSNAIPGANQSSFTPTESGSYSLSVIANSCSGSSECEEVIIAGVDEIELDLGLTLYPNPNQGKFSINLDNERNGSYVVSIYNTLGSLVYQENNITGNTFIIDLDQPASGIYMMMLQEGENVVKRPFLIE